jgi:hypothetical protein
MHGRGRWPSSCTHLHVLLGWLAFMRINVLVAVFWIPAFYTRWLLEGLLFSSCHHHLVPASLYLVPLVITVAVIYVYMSTGMAAWAVPDPNGVSCSTAATPPYLIELSFASAATCWNPFII